MAEPAAVYRLYDAADVLLYVGAAKDPEKRWKIHARERRWWPSVARKAVEWHPSMEDAYAAETAAIGAESPRYNIMIPNLNGGRPVMRRDAPPEAWYRGRPHWDSDYHRNRRERPPRAPRPPRIADLGAPYMGTAEIGRLIGVSRQRVHQLTAKPGFPEPYDVLAMGKVWQRADVEAWAREHGRLNDDTPPAG